MLSTWIAFLKNESGVTAIEYVLIASIISLSIIGGATIIGTSLNISFTNLANGFG